METILLVLGTSLLWMKLSNIHLYPTEVVLLVGIDLSCMSFCYPRIVCLLQRWSKRVATCALAVGPLECFRFTPGCSSYHVHITIVHVTIVYVTMYRRYMVLRYLLSIGARYGSNFQLIKFELFAAQVS